MRRIYISADLHGRYQPVRDFVKRNPGIGSKDDVLVLLGDTGVNYFFNHRDRELKEKLHKYPLTYFLIRGNHEERPSILAEREPDKWHKEFYFCNYVWVENEFPRIKYAMDYVTFYNLGSYSTLVVPGAFSVDKEYRLLMGYSWFEQEQLTEKERECGKKQINEDNEFDLLLSHTCPLQYEPKDLFLPQVDQSKVDKTTEQYLSYIYEKTDFKVGIWGHYHDCREISTGNNKRCLMLYNNHAIDLDEYMRGKYELK